jgi:SWI/SNF-related matrix-associated actin-dependent regulator 1 of chromatin subfamily A
MIYHPMFGWVVKDGVSYEDLYITLNSYMYRKRKEDVFKDFPKKMHTILQLELSDEELDEYKRIEKGVKEEISLFDDEIFITCELAITILGKLRKYLAGIKIKYIKEIIDNLLEQGEKIVITDPYRDTLSSLHELYKKESALHTGLVNLEERNQIVKNFQEGDLNIFLGSEKTSKEGLTLTSSCNMIQITQSYVPAVVDQLGDRINRIGQTRPCTICFPIFKNTIDEIVWEIVENKRKIISQIIDGEEYKSQYNSSTISEVLRCFLSK